MPQQDLPLDLVVLADLGLPAGSAALGRMHRIEPEAFAPWMAKLAPEAALGGGLRLAFEDPRAFRPESLATKIPDARALIELRQKVAQRGLEKRELDALIGGLPDGSPLKAAMLAASAPANAAAAPAAPAPAPAPAAAPATPAASSDDPLDAILGMVDVSGTGAPAAAGSPAPAAPKAATPASQALDKLVGLLGASRTGQAGSATQAGLAGVIDETLGATLRGVLRDPAFQAVESSWTGLRFLVRRIDARSGVRLHVLPTTRALLARHAREVLEPFTEETRREARVVVAIADFDLAGDADGFALAAALAAVAAENQMPIVAAADPRLLGIESMTAIDRVDDLSDRLGDASPAGWRELRATEDARWLALTINRWLMRLPYGAESDRVKGFGFEENPAGAEPSFLWARGPWLIAERIASSFVRTGWGVRITGQDEEDVVADLPVRMATLRTGEEVPAPLEAVLPERRAVEFSEGGLIALLCRQHGDFAFLAGVPMVHRAPGAAAAKSAAEGRRDTLPFAMFVAQVAAWIAHLESSGRFASDEERRAALARGVQFLSMTGDGPTLEAAVDGTRIRFTPWRDPLRGLPDFTLTLADRS